jgi:N6-L-threonylcarbamoyladenine synthase
MRVLALESSCDETAAAVVEGRRPDGGIAVRSSVVHSQVALHAPWGGVVPELASRNHVVKVLPVVDAALREAGVARPALATAIDGIAVTCGPGMMGALLVGLQVAKALAFAHHLPLAGVNHLEGHLRAVYLADGPPPAGRWLALLASGGHTSLILGETPDGPGPGPLRLVGNTRDDSAGEAFDKGARLLGLPYPGGAAIDRLAQGGDPRAVRFPRALPGQRRFDFSFSGLKTSLVTHLARAGGVPAGPALADLAASYQEAIGDVLSRKAVAAAVHFRCPCLVVAGGVAANSRLRALLVERAAAAGLALYLTPVRLCTDNAAMIGAAGLLHLEAGVRHDGALEADANLPLALS